MRENKLQCWLLIGFDNDLKSGVAMIYYWLLIYFRRVETALESFSRSIVDLNAGEIVAGHSASQTSLKQVRQERYSQYWWRTFAQ